MSIQLNSSNIEPNSIYILNMSFKSENSFYLQPLYRMINKIYDFNDLNYEIITDVQKLILLEPFIESCYVTGGVSNDNKEINLMCFVYFNSKKFSENEILLSFNYETECYLEENNIQIENYSLKLHKKYNEDITFVEGIDISLKLIDSFNKNCKKILCYAILKQKNSFITETISNTFPISTAILDYTYKYLQSGQEKKISPDIKVISLLSKSVSEVFDLESINIIYIDKCLNKDLLYLRRLYKNIDIDNYDIMFAIYT